MIIVTDKNRDEIIEEYANSILDHMDWDTLYTFAYEQLVQSKDLMDNKALEDEIKEYCPQILKD